MHSSDIRSDLNCNISHKNPSPRIKVVINPTIGLEILSSEVISKLKQRATIVNGFVTDSNMVKVGVTASKIASKTTRKDQIGDSIQK